MKTTSIILFVLQMYVCFACFRVYDGNTSISSNMISYLDYGEDIEKIPLHGFISVNWTRQEVNQKLNNTNQTIFTLHKIIEIDILGGIDISLIYKSVYDEEYDGMLISSSDRKIPGEIIYLYYKDTTRYDMYKFEINEEFLDEIIDTFPNGAYFNIFESDECDPYFNHWVWYYEGPYFYIPWIVEVIVALSLFIFCIYVLVVKWNDLFWIFRLCIMFYIIASFIRFTYGITFMVAKSYKQGEYVNFFKIMDMIGGLGSLNLTLAGILLYISYWQIVFNTILKDFGKLTRYPSVVISCIMVIMSIVSVGVFFLAESIIVYMVCYLFYVLVLLFTIIFSIVTMTKIVNKLSESTDKRSCCWIFKKSNSSSQETLRQFGIIFVTQSVCLILIVILFASVIYLVTPIQSTVLVCFVHELMGVIIFIHVRKFLNIEGSKSSSHISQL